MDGELRSITLNNRFKTDSLHTIENENVLKRLFKKLMGTNLEYCIEKLKRFDVSSEQLRYITVDKMEELQITD